MAFSEKLRAQLAAMPETENPEPNEESSSPETDAPEPPDVPPAGAIVPSARRELIRRIVMGAVLVVTLLGLWFDLKARRQCGRVTEELMYLLKPMEIVTTNRVREIVQRAPRIHELRSRYGGLAEEYVWKGVFNTYHLQVDYTWNFNRFEMDGIRSHSRYRWDSNQTSPAVEDQRPELVERLAEKGVENEIRRHLRKPEGELSGEDLRAIRKINLTGKQIQDLTLVAQMFALRDLNLSDNKLADVSELEMLTQLEVLRLHFNRLDNLDALSELTRLHQLDVGHNLIADTRAISQLPRLTHLTLRHNLITDLAPLGKLRRLEFLDLNHNQITDLGPVGELHMLDILRLSGNQIKNLAPLAQLPALEVLYLATNQVTDIRPLGEIAPLQRLDLAGNQITDVAELAKLKKLYQLNLTGNPVPVSEVEKLRKSLPRCEIKF
jgi:hypothetical protein